MPLEVPKHGDWAKIPTSMLKEYDCTPRVCRKCSGYMSWKTVHDECGDYLCVINGCIEPCRSIAICYRCSKGRGKKRQIGEE